MSIMSFLDRKYIWVYLFIFQWFFLKAIAFYPHVVEIYYSNGIYVFLSKILRTGLGYFPFSIGDCLYLGLILWAIYRGLKPKKRNVKARILAAIQALCVVSFFFHALWGFNYYRVPLYEKMHLKTEYSTQDLVRFTQLLIKKANKTQFLLTNHKNKKVIFPYSIRSIYSNNPLGYQQLAKKHFFFTYNKASIKTSLFSQPLTYMGFSGYLNPFTNEAQVNTLPPKFNLPATTAHEMAHQLGYASESECNFIGYLAVTSHPNLYYKYSGYTFALRYCISHINLINRGLAKQLMQDLHPGILKNLNENKQFQLQYTTFIDTIFEWFYDHFLKLNQQPEGINSYSKFLNLLIHYELKQDSSIS